MYTNKKIILYILIIFFVYFMYTIIIIIIIFFICCPLGRLPKPKGLWGLPRVGCDGTYCHIA